MYRMIVDLVRNRIERGESLAQATDAVAAFLDMHADEVREVLATMADDGYEV